MDKEVWFRSPRNLDMYSFHRRILTTQNLWFFWFIHI
jgi:hypothetical protein